MEGLHFFCFKKFYCGGMGWGGMGSDGLSKVSFNFFILTYIKHYTHKNLYIYKKNVLTNFLLGLKNWTSWGPDEKIQKHPLGCIFLKLV